MYYISLYFDQQTEERIQSLISQVAKKSGNSYMIEGKVPAHMTLTAFETKQEREAVELFSGIATHMSETEFFVSSVGMFLPNSLYLTPVLNKELFGMNLSAVMELSKLEDCSISKYYQPFQWQPHITVGKTLNKEQMKLAFEVLQSQFGPFYGKVTKIGLAKTNPYRDISIFELNEC